MKETSKKQKKPANPLGAVLKKLQSLFRRRPEPDDPYAYRMAKLRRPPGKGGTSAVAELDEE